MIYAPFGGYYRLKFEENGMYMGCEAGTVNSSIKQYSTANTDNRKFNVVNCLYDHFKIVPLSSPNGANVIALDNPYYVDTELSIQTYASDTGFEDEWIFHKVLPRSGGEPDTYTLGRVYDYLTNCYGYAFQGGPISFPHFIGEHLNPSGLQDGSTAQKIIDAVIDDAEYYSFGAVVIEHVQKCTAATYKVALFIDSYSTNGFLFHWYRQDKNGIWSYQNNLGGHVKNTDSSGKLIFDPLLADTGIYQVFISFFQASPSAISA